MDPRLQRRVQRYGWDKAARCYERYWASQLASVQTRVLEIAALRPGERVVDVACGTGLVTCKAATAVGYAGSVVGADISDAMVEAARAAAAQNGLTHVRIERADAEVLPLPAAAFDVAVCVLGLMYVADPLRASQEWWRVLDSGGRAVAAVWGDRKNCGWADIFPIVEARVRSEVCPLFFQLGTEAVLERTLAAAGFIGLATERITTVVHFDSGEDACGAAFAGGPVALAYSRFDAHTRDEAEAEYLASIAAYRSGNGYDIPGEFVISSGRKP